MTSKKRPGALLQGQYRRGGVSQRRKQRPALQFAVFANVPHYLRTHPRLRLDYLPRYQPGLNPQEQVWRRIRYEATTNRWFVDLDAIWTTVQRTRRSWSPQKLKRLCHIA